MKGSNKDKVTEGSFLQLVTFLYLLKYLGRKGCEAALTTAALQKLSSLKLNFEEAATPYRPTFPLK